MILGSTAIYTYTIVYHNYAGETVCGLVHSHLKDILGYLQTERHMLETVSAMIGIESGQI